MTYCNIITYIKKNLQGHLKMLSMSNTIIADTETLTLFSSITTTGGIASSPICPPIHLVNVGVYRGLGTGWLDRGPADDLLSLVRLRVGGLRGRATARLVVRLPSPANLGEECCYNTVRGSTPCTPQTVCTPPGWRCTDSLTGSCLSNQITVQSK